MKSIVEYLNESLLMESNDLWKQYAYVKKNMPKKIPFEEGQPISEEDLVNHYEKYLKNDNISYDDLSGIVLIGFEQYALANFEGYRLLDMKFSFNQSKHTTTLIVEYGPVDTPRKSKGTVIKKEGHEFDIKDGENKNVPAKDWVHAIITFFQDNIK